MQWHWKDALSVAHYVPHALHDLTLHEDKALIASAAKQLVRESAPLADSTAIISIEKDIDPAISRSQQNFGLLLRDYIHALPKFRPEGEQGEALLQHWRKILQEQPHRLAEAHLSSGYQEYSRQFWREKLSAYHLRHGDENNRFAGMPDDWEHVSGDMRPTPEILGKLKSQQWQELVLRQRLHNLDLDNMGIKHW